MSDGHIASDWWCPWPLALGVSALRGRSRLVLLRFAFIVAIVVVTIRACRPQVDARTPLRAFTPSSAAAAPAAVAVAVAAAS